MSKPKPATYGTTNWHDYSAALARRGALAVWFDPQTQWLTHHCEIVETGNESWRFKNHA